MPRRFYQPWSYVTAPLQGFEQAGAAGTAQQSEVIIPPGYGSYPDPMTSAINTFAESFMNQAAQQKAQKQYGEAVKGIGEFWPILQATGVTEGQVNEMLKSGIAPKDIVHYALTQQASRSMKGLEWGREDYTHARDIAEKSYTPEQMDVIDAYTSGKLSLGDAMRQSGLSASQLHSAISEASAGAALRKTPVEQAKAEQGYLKGALDIQKEKIELKNLPGKLQQEGAERLQRMELAKTRDEREQAKFEFEKWKNQNKTTKGLSTELQQQANSLKGLGSAQAMYAQALKFGLKVRPPNMAPKDLAGLSIGKDESKESYYKDVLLPALQNKQLQTQSQPGGSVPGTPIYNFPKGPYGAIAPKIAESVGLDPNIFGRMIEQESNWNPGAISPVGAFGMGQFMPGLAQKFGYTDAQVRKDPMLQLGLAASYLKQKLDEFGGDYAKALAAYNAGSEAVRKYNGVPPYKETQAYVKSILGTDNIQPVRAGLPKQKKSLDEIL